VLPDEQTDLRPVRREVGDHRQQRSPDRGREAGDPHRARRFGVRVEVEPGRLDRGEDGDGVLGQPPPGRRQAHPATVRLDQRRPDLAGQHGQLLRHGRRGHVQLVRDLAHRAEPGQFDQQPQATDVHEVIVQRIRTVRPQLARGRERFPSGLLTG
jgi:hypothetical protein